MNELNELIEKHSRTGTIMISHPDHQIKVLRRVPIRKGGNWFVRFRSFERRIVSGNEIGGGVSAIFEIEMNYLKDRQYKSLV